MLYFSAHFVLLIKCSVFAELIRLGIVWVGTDSDGNCAGRNWFGENCAGGNWFGENCAGWNCKYTSLDTKTMLKFLKS